MNIWTNSIDKSKLLSKCILLGSHNSASYCFDFDYNYDNAPNIKIINKLTCGAAAKIAEKVSKTQYGDISAQLLFGVRYFDIRIIYDKGWFCWHGYRTCALGEVLTQINIFSTSNKTELILLNLRFDNYKDNKDKNLKAFVFSFIGQNMINNLKSFDYSLGNLIMLGNIIVLINNDSSDDMFWDNNLILSNWYNTDSVSQTINKTVNDFTTDKYLVAQCLLTPQLNIKSILSGKYSVKKLSASTNKILEGFMKNPNFKNVRVILIDFCYYDMGKKILDLNK